LVKQGIIPALEDRLPVAEDVEVLAGPDGIGEFGGYYRQVQGNNYIGEWITASWNRRDSLGGLKWFPWVGKGWEVSPDGRVWTFKNRKDLKWSDGEPLDMESIEFAWELNFDPTFGRTFPLAFSDPITLNPPKFAVVDDVNWTLTYDSPIFTIMESRATPSSLCGPGRVCITGHPKMKKYYPQYAGQASIDKLIKDGGHADLTGLLNQKWQVYNNIEEIPCAAPFCAISRTDSQTEWEKNQYHWFVDPEGNQLPYLDGAVMPQMENRDVNIFRAMAGEQDGRTSEFIPGEIPLYIQNMDRGDFSIFHWPSSGGADLSTTMQQTYNEDPRIGELIRTQDFRVALSHSIDKETLNDVVLSGIGVVQNRVPRPNNPYYPGDEFKLLHMEKDIAKSNSLLDGLGLTRRDADDFRMHKDGSGTIDMQITINDNPAVVQSAELLRSAWESIGIKTKILVTSSLSTRRDEATSTIARDYSAYQYNPWMVQWTSLAPLASGSDMANQIGTWYSSKGSEGMSPSGGDVAWLPMAGASDFPADPTGLMRQSAELWIDGLGFSNLDPRRVSAGKEMFSTNADQLWALNSTAFSGVFRGVYVSRNNFRNKPITHERDHNGFTAWAHFFEDGLDNYHNPGNRSKYCQSWAFVQGGSPYDKCTKNSW
jgi:peptide/nickel transport system substrate-binding protein